MNDDINPRFSPLSLYFLSITHTTTTIIETYSREMKTLENIENALNIDRILSESYL